MQSCGQRDSICHPQYWCIDAAVEWSLFVYKVVVSIRNIFLGYWLNIFSHLISDGEIEWHQEVDIVLSFEFELLGS